MLHTTLHPRVKIYFSSTLLALILIFNSNTAFASNVDPYNTSSYVNFIEERIALFEEYDGLDQGDYGVQDGNLTIKELCNVGGKLVHTVDGFSRWSFEMYRMDLMTTRYYSALVGCASYPLFLLELLEPLQEEDQTFLSNIGSDLEQEKHNVASLVGRY